MQPRDLQVEKILSEGKNNPDMSWLSFAQTCLRAMFESNRTYGLFTTHFSEKLYASSRGIDYMQSIIGVAKVLEDVEVSQHNRPLYQDAKRFLEQDFWEIKKDNNAEIVNKFKEYFTARIIVRMDREMNAENLRIISFSDDRAALSKPSWWQGRGICYAIDSYVGNIEIVAKALVEGKAQVRISSTFDFWIDYTKLTVNGQIIFDKPTSAHYNKPYVHAMDVKAGEEIRIQAEWLPHRSDV